MIENKFILILASLRPRLLEKHYSLNHDYWEVRVFWFGKPRVLKIKDKR